MTIDKFMTEIADEAQPLRRSNLLQLSSLAREDLQDFRRAWGGITRARRREILALLVELSEDNLELDFSGVFRSCLSDKCEVVREQATRGLLETDDRMVIRPLVGLLTDDPSSRVRAAAAMSLSKFTDMAQQGKLMSRDEDRIREALFAVISKRGEAVDVRRRAIEAVASLDAPEVGGIVRAAYESGDPMMQQSAIYAMGRSSNSDWLPIVLEEINANNPAIRYEAANACGLLGDESVIPHMMPLITDEDSEVQSAALNAMGNIGGALARRALMRAASMDDDTLAEAAREALANLEFDDEPLDFRF